MSDAAQEDRTEAPTPKRRREARDRGQIARSPEVTTAFLLLASGGMLKLASPALAMYLGQTLDRSIDAMHSFPEGVEGVARHLGGLGFGFLAAVTPMLLALAGTALASGAVQAGGALSLEPMEPRWSRLDPLEKAGQLWGWRALAELPKSLLRLVVVGGAIALCLDRTLADASSLAQRAPSDLARFMWTESTRLLLTAGCAYLALAAADYAFQVWRNEKQMGMTKDEVRREVKESEGDQAIKMRRRSIARQLARRRMLRSVAQADVVVTNPTHIAVALRYDPDVAHAPVVLAMGERKVAERIKELARAAGVPVIENKPLARSLLATGRVGEPIPVDLFVAVAGVLAWVYRVQGAGRARSARQASRA